MNYIITKKVTHAGESKKGRNTPLSFTLHEYYTPKCHQIQDILVIFTIFVNYAHFYVNTVMLTFLTGK